MTRHDPPPDTARGWKFVEDLLAEEEARRIENLTDEELAEERRGMRPVASLEQLLARGAQIEKERQAAEAADKPKVVALPAKRPARLMWLMAAAFLLLLGGLAATQGPAIVAFFKGEKNEPIGPDNEKPALPTPREVAEKLRDEAVVACDGEILGTCRDKLDQAKKLDPAGESEPRVQAARALIASRMYPDARMDGKPGRN